MSAVDYSLIFLSLVISYIVSVAMSGWGKLVKHYNSQKFSTGYLLWSLNLFFYLLFIWFWPFSYHLVYLDSYFWFTLIMIRLLIIYLCLEVLIPEGSYEYNYLAHFLLVKQKFFLLLTVLWTYEIALYLLMGHNVLTTRGVLYFTNLPISLSLIFFKGQKYLRFSSIVAFIVMLLALMRHMWEQQNWHSSAMN